MALVGQHTFTDRTLKPLGKKLNPVWWFMNDDETSTDFVFKYIRNPLSNFCDYVIGVCDRNYTVRGTDPVELTAWNDVGQLGWKWSVISLGWLRLPFVSYSGKRVLWYVGWQYGGNFGVKWNLLHSTIQVL